MKRLATQFMLKLFLAMLFVSFLNLAALAQDSGGSESTTTTTHKTTITTSDNAWYTSPWVWVAGAAVIILLLVALLSNRGRDTVTTDRISVTKTVERDSGADV